MPAGRCHRWFGLRRARSRVAERDLLLTPRATGPQTPAVGAIAAPHAMGWGRSRGPSYGLSSVASECSLRDQSDCEDQVPTFGRKPSATVAESSTVHAKATVQIHLRLLPEDAELLRSIAAEGDRTLSSAVRHLLRLFDKARERRDHELGQPKRRRR